MHLSGAHGVSIFALLLLAGVLLSNLAGAFTLIALFVSRHRNVFLANAATLAVFIGGSVTALVVLDGWTWDWFDVLIVGPLVIGVIGWIQWIRLGWEPKP